MRILTPFGCLLIFLEDCQGKTDYKTTFD